jgi:hypothetical protein
MFYLLSFKNTTSTLIDMDQEREIMVQVYKMTVITQTVDQI